MIRGDPGRHSRAPPRVRTYLSTPGGMPRYAGAVLHAAPLGRTLPRPPSAIEVEARAARLDDDLSCAKEHTTPRPPEAVERLARRILSGTQLTKYWIAWSALALALWAIGTAVAIVLAKTRPAWGTTPLVALGFGGLALGFATGALWIQLRKREARKIAREGQLVTGAATYRRSQHSFGGELSSVLATPLGETRYCLVFSIGFIQHEMWVALPASHVEGAPHQVLVQPGARVALAFDRLGRGYVGDVRVRS